MSIQRKMMEQFIVLAKEGDAEAETLLRAMLCSIIASLPVWGLISFASGWCKEMRKRELEDISKN